MSVRRVGTQVRMLSAGERLSGFAEVELGFTEQEALREAMRCLLCNSEICTGCKLCAIICPNNVFDIETEIIDSSARAVVKFDVKNERCMYCGLCVENCPTKTLVMDAGAENSSERKCGMNNSLPELLQLVKRY